MNLSCIFFGKNKEEDYLMPIVIKCVADTKFQLPLLFQENV